MTVQSILSRKGTAVFTVEPTASIQDATKSLTAHNIGALVVTGIDGHVEGIVSERDILQALSAEGAGALVRPVAEIMTCKVMTCAPSDRLADVMAMMTDGKLRHLPVIENGRLVGIVSIRDVVELRLEEAAKEVTGLDKILARLRLRPTSCMR